MKAVAIIALVLAIFAAARSADAASCHPGDTAVGPNCVHVDETPVPNQPQPYSTVYRTVRAKQVVVWEGFALVQTATAKKLVVSEWSSNDQGVTGFWTVEYTWNGKSYQ